MVLTCPTCGKQASAPENLAGQIVACPHCQAKIRVPGGDQPETPSDQGQTTYPTYSSIPPPQYPGQSQPPYTPPPASAYQGNYSNWKNCVQCGDRILDYMEFCPLCGIRQPSGSIASSDAASKKVTAAVCAFLFGGLGVHKFVLGYNNAGLIMMLVSVFTCCIGGMVMGPIAIAEGIIYLTKSDEEFEETYIRNQKEWF